MSDPLSIPQEDETFYTGYPALIPEYPKHLSQRGRHGDFAVLSILCQFTFNFSRLRVGGVLTAKPFLVETQAVLCGTPLAYIIDGPLVLPLFKGRSGRGDGLESIEGLSAQSRINGFVAKPSLYEFYNATFENVVADTDALRTESYRLRHQVYCFEIKTEKPNLAGLECDAYDGSATHFLLRYRPSNIFIGTTRVILPPPGPEAQPLPYMKLCKTAQIAMPSGFPHERAPEVSRFALSKDFRRRALDTSCSIGYIQEDLKEDRARIAPCLIIGLIAMMYQFSRKNGYDRWCAVMKPALSQLLSKLGMHMVPVGPLVEYHGSRQICYIILDDLKASVIKRRPDIAEIITDGGRY